MESEIRISKSAATDFWGERIVPDREETERKTSPASDRRPALYWFRAVQLRVGTFKMHTRAARNALPGPLAILTALVLGLGGSLPATAEDDDSAIASLRETGKAFASVARKVSPSVVFVQVEATPTRFGGRQGGRQSPFGEDFLRRFFGEQGPNANPRAPRQEPPAQSGTPQRRPIGQGSGFVFAADSGLLSNKSYILTNNHVVENGEFIRVTFQDGREFEATVTGRDPKSDVAVLEVNTGELPVLPFADSGQLDVGEWVVALGNPFGLSHTLTVGVVSATGRTSLGINDYEDFIQTDAAINPGNSGGPLVNLSGEVVGINTAIFSRSGGYMGVGFAIPINLARQIAEQLIDNGEVTRGFLGVVIQPLDQELAESFGLDRTQGIAVAQVSDGSPAAAAGIEVGDVIVEFDGRAVRDVGSFRNSVSLTPPGKKKQLVVIRGGKRQKLSVTIGDLEAGTGIASGPAQTSEELGLTVQTIDDELGRQFSVQPGAGVVVTAVAPGSIAANGGLRPGMVIMQVNRRTVATAQEFAAAVDASSESRRVLLLIRSGETQQFLVLSW